MDIIISNGTIIDGRRRPRYTADVGIQQNKIVAIGDLSQQSAGQRIDATNHIVCPGFIDVHTHSDAHLARAPHIPSKTAQGITTEFLMLDGFGYAPFNEKTARDWIYYMRPINGMRFEEYSGWRSIADFMGLLDGRVAQNVVAHVPYANVRTIACGFGRSQLDDFQMQEIQRMIRQGMAEGAVGLSSGLDYADECLASTAELVEACRAMAPDNGVYVTHIRYKRGILEGVKEAVEIGRRANVPVHISHLKSMSDAENEGIIDYINKVAMHEVDFSFDVYPYVPSSTSLHSLLPYEVFADGPLAAVGKLKSPQIRDAMARHFAHFPLDQIRIAWVATKDNSRYQGETLQAYIDAVGKAPVDALSDLLIEESMAVLLVFKNGDNRFVEPFLSHERFMLGSDGILFDGLVHPRQFGSAPRLLGYYAREKKLFSLEEGVYKMSGFPAERFGLEKRGQIAEGYFADIAIFDPEKISEKGTMSDPNQHAVGVRDVLVNGTVIRRNGEPIMEMGDWPGRYLKKGNSNSPI